MCNPPLLIIIWPATYSCPRVTGVTVPAGSIIRTGGVVNWVAGGSDQIGL